MRAIRKETMVSDPVSLKGPWGAVKLKFFVRYGRVQPIAKPHSSVNERTTRISSLGPRPAPAGAPRRGAVLPRSLGAARGRLVGPGHGGRRAPGVAGGALVPSPLGAPLAGRRPGRAPGAVFPEPSPARSTGWRAPGVSRRRPGPRGVQGGGG